MAEFTCGNLSIAIKMYDDSRNNYHSLLWKKWDGTPSTDMKKLTTLLNNLTHKADTEECIINDILDSLVTHMTILKSTPSNSLQQKKYFLTRSAYLTQPGQTRCCGLYSTLEFKTETLKWQNKIQGYAETSNSLTAGPS
jgi:hypothetical protein